MSKCVDCRKNDALLTWKDKLTDWLIYRIFPQTVKDVRTNAHLQAFTVGYNLGYKTAKGHAESVYKLHHELNLSNVDKS